MAPKYLKAQLEVKAKKLKKLEDSYGQVVRLKQAEPAVCALYKIGLAYKRFAQTLYAAPIPREIRGDRALVEEYKSLLSQQAEPLEAKSIDGLALAVNAARDYGVVNDCARQATAILVKHKPEEYGPRAEVEGVPVRAAGARRADPTLPPLRVRTTGGHDEPGPGAEPTTLDPQRRVIRDEPVPAKQKRKKKGSPTDDDEDLLP